MDQHLVDAARRGAADQIDRLIEAIWPDAYRLALAVVGDPAGAQDVAQDACISVYRTIGSLRDAAAFRAWLYRIVVREASAHKRRRPKIADACEGAIEPQDTEGTLDVWRALDTLPATLREVVVLRYFEDLSSREIARILRIPSATVRFRLMVARERLRPLLDERSTALSQEGRVHAF